MITIKKFDFSLLALVFFITRSIFSLTTYNNLITFSITVLISFFILQLINKSKKLITNKYLIFIILIFISYYLLHNFTNFVANNYFTESTRIIINISFLVLIYFININDFRSLKDLSELLFLIFIVSFILIIILSIKDINIINLKSFITSFKINISLNSFLPITTGFILSFLVTKDNCKEINSAYILSIFTILISLIILYSLLGKDFYSFYKYPDLSLLKQLPLFILDNRVDSLISLVFLFSDTVTISYCLSKIKEKSKNLYLISFLNLIPNPKIVLHL